MIYILNFLILNKSRLQKYLFCSFRSQNIVYRSSSQIQDKDSLPVGRSAGLPIRIKYKYSHPVCRSNTRQKTIGQSPNLPVFQSILIYQSSDRPIYQSVLITQSSDLPIGQSNTNKNKIKKESKTIYRAANQVQIITKTIYLPDFR